MTDAKATELIAAVNRLADLYDEMTRPQRKVLRSQYEDARIVNELVELRASDTISDEEVPAIYRDLVSEETTKVLRQRGVIEPPGRSTS